MLDKVHVGKPASVLTAPRPSNAQIRGQQVVESPLAYSLTRGLPLSVSVSEAPFDERRREVENGLEIEIETVTEWDHQRSSHSIEDEDQDGESGNRRDGARYRRAVQHGMYTERKTSTGGSTYTHIPKAYFDYAQRALSTLTIAGTFMAGVEAQLVAITFTAVDSDMKTASLCFGITALLGTSFVALYCAVTYIWLKQDWKNGPKLFDEWVAGSCATMLVWSGTVLVVGVYAGFLGLMFFLFGSTSRAVALYSTFVFVLCGIGPMSWGFYYWWGLYRGRLQWQPDLEGQRPRKMDSSMHSAYNVAAEGKDVSVDVNL